MRPRQLWTALVLIIAVPALQAASPDFAPDEIIVRFKSSVPAPSQGLSAASFSSLASGAAQALSSVSATQIIPLKASRISRSVTLSAQAVDAFEPISRTYRVRLPAGSDVMAAVARISADASVELAEPNIRMHLFQTPNDTSYSLQWALKNTGQVGSQDGYDPATGTAGADVDAEAAWNATTGSASTVVAIIDSGLDTAHPDIAANLWTNPGDPTTDGVDNDANGFLDDVHGWDFGNDDNNVADNCGFEQGHGTHVAGIIGAVGNNAVGVSGMNWNVQLMALKVAKSDENCNIYTSDIVDAITYATNKGARVINMSLGGEESTTMHTACDAAKAAGVVLVAAAGNDGVSSTVGSYPAAYSSVIGVAATNRRDQLASFSNYGSWVSLAAPGVAIYSTFPTADVDGPYKFESGTSMASPIVAGIAALVRAEYPTLNAAEVEDRLLASCENIGVTGIGAGRVNAARALLNVTAISPIEAGAGQDVSFTISGVALHSGVSFRLTKSGTASVTGTNVNIAAHNQATCDFNVPLQSTGVYNVQVVIGQTTVTLSAAVTIYGLSVTGISPTYAPSGTTVNGAQLTGQNFADGVSFYLRKTGQSNIAGTSLLINSQTSATADFDLTGAAGGRWDVVAASASLAMPFSSGFAVTTPLYQVVTPPVGSASQFTMALSQGTLLLDWPANATASPIDVDIDAAPTLPAIDPNRDPYVGTGIGVDLLQANATPTFNASYRLTLPFLLTDIPDPAKLSALTIAYYNTTTHRWEPIKDVTVDEAARTVSGSANHFSAFQIVQHVPSANLDKTIAYPNPFRPDRGHDRIVFDFLKAGSLVKVFDISGQLVRELTDDDGDGRIDWIGVTNDDGDKIASGVYYFVATGDGQSKTGRVAVVR